MVQEAQTDTNNLLASVVPGLALAAVFFHLGYVASSAQPALHTALLPLGLGSYGLGFVALIGSLSSRSVWADRILPGLCVVAFVTMIAINHQVNPSIVNPAYEKYQSDSLAFSAYSAQLVLDGKDPYVESMAPALERFNVSPTVYTPTVEGGTILIEPYPALSFLVYVPFVAAHVPSMIWVDIGFTIFSMLLILALVPAQARIYFGLFFLLIPEYLSFAVGSVTDVLWLPLMIGVAATWERRPILCAVLLGLACAMKQEPWFIVPFALIHWWKTSEQEHALATTLRRLGYVSAAFLVPNLPFLLWHPGAWLRGVLSPLLSHAVPLGSGLIQLQTSGLITLPLGVYTALWVAALIVCVAAYAKWTQELRWLPFVAPAIVLFFSPRSLQNYFIYWPLVLGVYAAVSTVKLPPLREVAMPRLAAGTVVLAVAGVASLIGLIGATAAAGERIELTVRHVSVDADTGLIDGVVVRVDNPTSNSQTLHFAISSPLNSLVFWRPERFEIPAHGTATIHLTPSGLAEEVPYSKDVGFQVVAYAPQDRIAAYTRSLSDDVPEVRHLRNGRLKSVISKFQMLPARAPLAWNAEPQPFLDGRLQAVAAGPFGNALRFRVSAPTRSEWDVVQLSQPIVTTNTRFTFWLKPLQSYAPTRSAQTFGISFRDARGRRSYFVVDSHVRRMTHFTRDRDAYYLLPGRVGEWNRYTIDLARLPVYAQSRGRQLTVSIVDAVHRDYRNVGGGEFGGIVETAADPVTPVSAAPSAAPTATPDPAVVVKIRNAMATVRSLQIDVTYNLKQPFEVTTTVDRQSKRARIQGHGGGISILEYLTPSVEYIKVGDKPWEAYKAWDLNYFNPNDPGYLPEMSRIASLDPGKATFDLVDRYDKRAYCQYDPASFLLRKCELVSSTDDTVKMYSHYNDPANAVRVPPNMPTQVNPSPRIDRAPRGVLGH